MPKSRKIFLSSTKMGYGRPDILYFLNDLGRVSNDYFLSNGYAHLLNDNCATNSEILEWEDCITRLEKQLKKQKFDFSIGIGNLGRYIITDLLKRGVAMGDAEVFYVTRLSNSRWEKIGYVHTPERPALEEQMRRIERKMKNKKRVAIVDDVTYSGGTRKALLPLFGRGKKFCAIDLITLATAKKKFPLYTDWYSGYMLKYDPYPTLASKSQADVMNVSEFIYPSKYIGKITQGAPDKNKILWSGKYSIFKKYAYTSSTERRQVYFGESSSLVYEETKRLQKFLKIYF